MTNRFQIFLKAMGFRPRGADVVSAQGTNSSLWAGASGPEADGHPDT